MKAFIRSGGAAADRSRGYMFALALMTASVVVGAMGAPLSADGEALTRTEFRKLIKNLDGTFIGFVTHITDLKGRQSAIEQYADLVNKIRQVCRVNDDVHVDHKLHHLARRDSSKSMEKPQFVRRLKDMDSIMLIFISHIPVESGRQGVISRYDRLVSHLKQVVDTYMDLEFNTDYDEYPTFDRVRNYIELFVNVNNIDNICTTVSGFGFVDKERCMEALLELAKIDESANSTVNVPSHMTYDLRLGLGADAENIASSGPIDGDLAKTKIEEYLKGAQDEDIHTFVFAHGWTSWHGRYYNSIKQMIKRLKRRRDVHNNPNLRFVFLNVEWNAVVNGTYTTSACRAGEAAKALNDILTLAGRDQKILNNNTVLVGHSLGAEMLSIYGNYRNVDDKAPVGAMYALDAAYPIFGFANFPKLWAIGKQTAVRTHLIHTSPLLGYLVPETEYDIYMDNIVRPYTACETQVRSDDLGGRLSEDEIFRYVMSCNHNKAIDAFENLIERPFVKLVETENIFSPAINDPHFVMIDLLKPTSHMVKERTYEEGDADSSVFQYPVFQSRQYGGFTNLKNNYYDFDHYSS